MVRLDIADLKAKGYKSGSIVRVGMHNFLTYDDVDIYPGPRLNVVLGPNGTGKSAMTHAVCLACGGTPQAVGRSDDLRQFVKHGKEQEDCYAEVDLLDNDVIHTVRRSINSTTRSSKWSINGRSATQTAVKDLMSKLNIDVENLCSFMPQDRVGAFTTQTPQGIGVVF